jgi:NADH:ubiquinone oxidoreductase subunit F (NADH-binding)
VPSGITLRQLIVDYCGGMKDGQELKAFAPSGPSGGFLPAMLPVKYLPAKVKEKLPPDATHFDILDLELDTNVFRELTNRNQVFMLGGGMVVYGEDADMVEQALSCQKFYRNESCGKCVPCRIGSQKLVEIGTDLHQKKYTAETLKADQDSIKELKETMVLTAICGLGTVAPNPLTSVLEHFPADVERYLNGR